MSASICLQTFQSVSNTDSESKEKKATLSSVAEVLLSKTCIDKTVSFNGSLKVINPYSVDREEESSEKEMSTLARLVLNTALRTIKALQSGKYTQFDALVGDFSCQLRAFQVYDLVLLKQLQEEAKNLSSALDASLKDLRERPGKISKNAAGTLSSGEFFKQKVQAIKVSEEMAFLMRAHLLTVTKVNTLKQGIEVEFTDISRLAQLSPKIDSEISRNIVDRTQSRMSQESILAIQQEAQLVSLLSEGEKKLLVSMLQVIRTNASQDIGKDIAKSFSCLFFNFKTGLLRLIEKQAFVLVKQQKFEKGKKPITILFQGSPKQRDFVLIKEGTVIAKETPIIVFEGDFTSDEKLKEFGLLDVLLVNAAQENQFEQGSKLSDIENDDARREIQQFIEKAQKMGCVIGQKPFFLLDHVYCSCFAEQGGTS